MTRLGNGMWLAVCDGGKAMLLENKGDWEYPKLEMREHLEQSIPPSRDLGTAPPGRAFSGARGRRAGMEQTDYHDQAEEIFLAAFADRINRLVSERGIRLFLAAPPRALGMLRPHLTEKTRAALAAELPHDYVKRPLYEIEKLICAKAG